MLIWSSTVLEVALADTGLGERVARWPGERGGTDLSARDVESPAGPVFAVVEAAEAAAG
jgi:hypothetical protein